ncbi:flagellar regulator YcgR PilZN domain-containing protein [Cupriavidus sp. 30B13]|uniref:flagellar regulator YcgR PilZN domain-containing protein n=1 Tax=Cupriavidus sp. 30B13 TaxID=3384241 RepID=UPI003B98125B
MRTAMFPAHDDDRASGDPGHVLRTLLDLARQRALLHFQPAGMRRVATMLLRAEPSSRTCILAWCRDGAELDAILNARELHVGGMLNGAPVRFPVCAPAIARFDGQPAFIVPFPARIHHLHRRRHFRASAPAGNGFRCEILAGDGALAEMSIVDLSVSGIGLRATGAGAPPWPGDARRGRCRLVCGELGTLELDFEVVRHRIAWRGGNAIHHVGAAFRDVDGQAARRLQRLVFAFELAHRA